MSLFRLRWAAVLPFVACIITVLAVQVSAQQAGQPISPARDIKPDKRTDKKELLPSTNPVISHSSENYGSQKVVKSNDEEGDGQILQVIISILSLLAAISSSVFAFVLLRFTQRQVGISADQAATAQRQANIAADQARIMERQAELAEKTLVLALSPRLSVRQFEFVGDVLHHFLPDRILPIRFALINSGGSEVTIREIKCQCILSESRLPAGLPQTHWRTLDLQLENRVLPPGNSLSLTHSENVINVGILYAQQLNDDASDRYFWIAGVCSYRDMSNVLHSYRFVRRWNSLYKRFDQIDDPDYADP